jgi:hypothetical protein
VAAAAVPSDEFFPGFGCLPEVDEYDMDCGSSVRIGLIFPP